jgi:tetratricopeptide (TPR) repeat protein
LLVILRRSDEAIYAANLGLKMDPLKPLALGLYGVVMSSAGNYRAAIESFEKALAIDPNFAFARFHLGNAIMAEAYESGDYDKWIEAWDKKVEAGGNWHPEARMAVRNAFEENGFKAAIEEMLRLNREFKNCYMDESIKAERYFFLGDYDPFIDNLEKRLERKEVGATYMATDMSHYQQLKDHPRYKALLKKMNLPGDENR